MVPDSELIKPLSKIDIGGCITSLGCIDTSYLLQCCQGINDFQNLDLAPLMVCLQYLTQLEVSVIGYSKYNPIEISNLTVITHRKY